MDEIFQRYSFTITCTYYTFNTMYQIKEQTNVGMGRTRKMVLYLLYTLPK